MKLHERTMLVQKARHKHNMFVCDLISEYGLTYGEIANVLLSSALDWNKYQIREERHPDDPDKKGDEA